MHSGKLSWSPICADMHNHAYCTYTYNASSLLQEFLNYVNDSTCNIYGMHCKPLRILKMKFLKYLPENHP